MENYPDPNDLKNIIFNRKRNLWERQIESDDFLNVRIGIGTVPLKLKLNYSLPDFTMVEDNLKDKLNSITESAKNIPSCPVTISLTERNKLVIIGEKYYRENMLKSLVLQLTTYHSYNELKLVFLLSDTTNEIWKSFKLLPHLWTNDRDIRFYADNYDDISKISFYMDQVFTSRKYSDEDGKQVETNITYKNVRPYYLIIVDNIKKNKNVEIVNKILKEDSNLGFGLIILNDGISNLPNECSDFLTVGKDASAIIKNDLNKNNQISFVIDNLDNINLPLLCEKISNIPIKQTNVLNEFNSSIGFLEMYNVGKVEHLNVLDRWKKNSPINSLSVPIGVHTDGALFNLDLHEKFHGPHGLIAGMTGSGKSEFIITYILSMCLNFSPLEVSFVLIDYKGGGLTGAFENKLSGLRLPHLAGTITNLDTAEIKRSLSSIQSELKRRQELFNEVKNSLNESTLDIYKYQKLYRDKVINTPMSHLFIICDEFAELKSEQPEFMSELISTARIGRSLGVHLILATQKPSGIVDDQIWSNSKFKVCLKVQERADSMDVIKCPDATYLKKAGRFYLQVGYNDYFAMGQSAFAGTKYIPKDIITKVVDRNLSFINNIGDTINSIETVKRVEGVSHGEELQNVLKYISDVAKNSNMVANKLWLDKIPNEIFVGDIIKKYNYKTQKYDITAILGEYDDPHNQRQDLLKLNLNENSNTIIYGSTGKELMLSTIIYSLIINHFSDEINIYILDFGTEMLGIYSNAPQVGDIVLLSQEEKVLNLFNKLAKELTKRKKIFSDYNGNYNLYIRNSGKTLPRILIIINNYEAFCENYEDYIDVVASLSREGEKYGISFIITASGANSVRSKTSQNFSNLLCLQFNDKNDYASVLGTTHGMVPSSVEGRGLVKLDNNLYEFQTAYPYKWDKINLYIKQVCNKLNERLKIKADKIPLLPEYVRLSDIVSKIDNIKSVPIGIEKDSLLISTYNFDKNPITLISSLDISLLVNFVPSLAQVFQNITNVDLHLVDAIDILYDCEMFKNYYNSNFDVMIEKIQFYMCNTDDLSHVFIIYGVESFMNSLATTNQQKIKDIFIELKNYKNIRIIFIDSISKLKNYEYDNFYKSCIQPMDAIWVGYGITEQYTIKCNTYNKQTRGQLQRNFGFNVDKGNAKLIKILDFYGEDEVD